MNPEPSQRQCAACKEPEPSFILTVVKDNVPRRLCTDCLLKEHRSLFCLVCLDLYVAAPTPETIKTCFLCSSKTHLHCPPPPPSSLLTCPLCFDRNFSFFPKSLDNDGSEAVLDMKKAKALVTAAEIAVFSAKKAAAELEKVAVKKSTEAKDAKKKAKEALVYLENMIEKAEEKRNAKKRKLQ